MKTLRAFIFFYAMSAVTSAVGLQWPDNSEVACQKNKALCAHVALFLNYPEIRPSIIQEHIDTGRLKTVIDTAQTEAELDYFFHEIRDRNNNSMFLVAHWEDPRFAYQLEAWINEKKQEIQEEQEARFNDEINLEIAPHPKTSHTRIFFSSKPSVLPKIEEQETVIGFTDSLKEKKHRIPALY